MATSLRISAPMQAKVCRAPTARAAASVHVAPVRTARALRSVVTRAEESTASWATGAEAAGGAEAAAPSFRLAFLWLDKNIAVGVDQVLGNGAVSPVTEYYFWPRKDAWEDLKAALEARPWISERDRVVLLNRTTEVINFWQDEAGKHSIEEATDAFPECSFTGA
ncbi:unnamed protein product [Pedinophyceae sp. YPF-701]|nr:unnamed protein product [Pedinophyceae sp. YPF-701]